tara:strand:- start:483 stop:1349 length:867 start_codon:yes stop_codon:yes gene_type:complete
MPELPEVEIVRQSLSKKIKGKVIKKVLVKNRNLRFKLPYNFENYIIRKKIKKIDRFSKYLILIFQDNTACIIHLGMSGTIHLVKKNNSTNITNTSFYNYPKVPKKHNHIEIKFNNIKLIYNDPRRFGYFLFINDKDNLKEKFSRFGPEPFSSLFNIKYIKIYLKNKKKNIKNLLLDQKFVSGIGNIYASEILFFCKIHPDKKGKNIKEKDIKKIIYYSKFILKRAIKKGGSSIRDFKNISGDQGSFQKDFKVYQRENLKCLNRECLGIVKKKIISNRSSFFCNICQKQ